MLILKKVGHINMALIDEKTVQKQLRSEIIGYNII